MICARCAFVVWCLMLLCDFAASPPIHAGRVTCRPLIFSLAGNADVVVVVVVVNEPSSVEKKERKDREKVARRFFCWFNFFERKYFVDRKKRRWQRQI